MTDGQIALEFLEMVARYGNHGVAAIALVAIIGEARTTERARCAAIVAAYTDDHQPGPVQIAAREMLAKIEEVGT